jgi:hypothetical protein
VNQNLDTQRERRFTSGTVYKTINVAQTAI